MRLEFLSLSLDDARLYKLGTYNGSWAIPIVESHGIPMDVAPDDQSNLKKMAIKRSNLWAASLLTGPFMAKRSGVVGLKPVLIIGSASNT